MSRKASALVGRIRLRIVVARYLIGMALPVVLAISAGCGSANVSGGPTATTGRVTAAPTPGASTALVALPEPAPLQPFSSPLLGEGTWRPAGRLVGGHAVLFETVARSAGSNLEAGVAWMDTRLLRAQLYSGSASPGGSSVGVDRRHPTGRSQNIGGRIQRWVQVPGCRRGDTTRRGDWSTRFVRAPPRS